MGANGKEGVDLPVMVCVTHPLLSCAGNLHPLHHLGEENERHTWAPQGPSHSQGAPDTMDFVTCVLDAAHLSAINFLISESS